MVDINVAEEPGKTKRRPGDVLVLNVGSSSVKFALYPLAAKAAPRWKGRIVNLGLAEAVLTIDGSNGSAGERASLGQLDHLGALRAILGRSSEMLADSVLAAIGHRVVHGGPHFAGPVLLDRETIEHLHAMDRYDPAHQEVELGYIEALARRWPGLPQVACFDTSFHRTLPEVAQRLPVPQLDVARGLRRYGFHGLSYTHAVEELRRAAGEAVANGRVIIAHLGNGASMAAVRNGQGVETTMGFTPTGGLPMSGRSGDIDPGVFLWLARHGAMTVEGIFEMMTRQSGVLAISETSADLKDLVQIEDEDDRAAAALEYFCYHARKAIGALAAVLGGLDVVVFTGGIGEHLPAIRERVCAGLEFLGVSIDRARNRRGEPVISPAGAKVMVRVIAADEERIIAQAVRDVLAEAHIAP